MASGTLIAGYSLQHQKSGLWFRLYGPLGADTMRWRILLRPVVRAHDRRKAINELSMLTDAQLRDLGMERDFLPELIDAMQQRDVRKLPSPYTERAWPMACEPCG